MRVCAECLSQAAEYNQENAIVCYILKRSKNFPDVSPFAFFFGNTLWC